MTGIYSIVNLITYKRYIGSSTDIERRFREHKKDLRRGIHHNEHLQKAWVKYGEEAFIFTVLREIEETSIENLRKIEKETILLHKSNNSKYGYNLALPDENSLGVGTHSEITKEKMRRQAYERMFGETSEEAYQEWRSVLKSLRPKKHIVRDIVAVNLVSEEVEYIAESIAEMARILNCDKNRIQECLKCWDSHRKKKRKSYHGYKFLYRDVYESGNYDLDHGRTLITKPIIQYDLEGNIIAEFQNTNLAAKSLGISEGTIASNLKGFSKVCKRLKSVFKYKEVV